MSKVVQIVLSNKQFVEACYSDEFKDHRDLIQHLFFGRGWVVINFMELRYFYRRDYVKIEGVVGEALISR